MNQIKIKDFFSRKNKTSLILVDKRQFVRKEFIMGDAKLEWRMLHYCMKNGIRAPLPIAFEDNVIIMEYLEAEPLADRDSLPKGTCKELARWLFSFHSAFPGMKRGDSMLRNFLELDGMIYGIDFEEAGWGEQLEDVSTLCASILTEDPIYEREKRRAVRTIIDAYSNACDKRVEDRLLELIKHDLFTIYHRWSYYRGRKEDGILEWCPFCKTVL